MEQIGNRKVTADLYHEFGWETFKGHRERSVCSRACTVYRSKKVLVSKERQGHIALQDNTLQLGNRQDLGWPLGHPDFGS